MKLFALSSSSINSSVKLSTFLSALIIPMLLTSCSAIQQREKGKKLVAPVEFNYSYRRPSRQIVSSALSLKLSKGKAGDMLYTQFKGKKSTIRLGQRYYSASGYKCRRYTVNPSNTKAACKINGRWYQAKPILIKK